MIGGIHNGDKVVYKGKEWRVEGTSLMSEDGIPVIMVRLIGYPFLVHSYMLRKV